jgi:hypothetical protein
MKRTVIRHDPRRRKVLVLGASLAVAVAAGTLGAVTPAVAADVTVYKSASCGCCGAWVDHLRENGFSVTVREQDDLDPVKALLGIPDALQACHTATVGGYVIEGHVPARDIRRLLDEQPRGIGLAVPGMPVGSPGMEQGGAQEPYQVLLFGAGGVPVFNAY